MAYFTIDFFQREETLSTLISWTIAVLTFISIVAFLLTLFLRRIKVKNKEIKESYQQIIDQTLMEILFTDANPEEVFSKTKFSENLHKSLFKKLAIRSIITLRNNYVGEYVLKLKQIYTQSSLINYSVEKLNSRKWYYVIEGIRDLSSMEVAESYSDIERMLKHKNSMVQLEAMVGIIKLKGIDQLIGISTLDLHINDWQQANIFYTIKEQNMDPPEHMDSLLRSNNPSFLLLCIRLIDYYNLSEYRLRLAEIYNFSSDPNLKIEIDHTLEKFKALAQ